MPAPISELLFGCLGESHTFSKTERQPKDILKLLCMVFCSVAVCEVVKSKNGQDQFLSTQFMSAWILKSKIFFQDRQRLIMQIMRCFLGFKIDLSSKEEQGNRNPK